MTDGAEATPLVLAKAVIARGVWLLAAWCAIAGAAPADLLMGIATAIGAVWASLVLLPPRAGRVRILPLLRLLTRLLWQSIIAGADVALRALAPRMPLAPGFVRCRPIMPPGPTRNVFTSLMSLVPGTLPAGQEPDGALIVHCLDVSEPVVAAMAREEAIWHETLGGTSGNG